MQGSRKQFQSTPGGNPPGDVRDSDVSVNVWSNVNGELWYCALKTTGAHDELYLLSLRRAGVEQARARLSPEQLERLGVA